MPKAMNQKQTANVLLLLMISLAFSLEATDYYVATDGNDNNAGSMANPFRTIGAASTLMLAGDNCFIREGTYNETIRPANSGTVEKPITFQAYGTEVVTISAANVISGWAVSSNNIYVASFPTDLGAGYNQVFVNGNMLIEARYPNTGTDPLSPTLANGTASTSSVNLAVSRPANYWVGAKVWGLFGHKWTSQCATVTASSVGGNLTITNKSQVWYPGSGSAYMTGIFSELDSAGEWFISSGKIYLWAPASAHPNSLKVEAKCRSWCIDLSGKSNIIIQRLNLFGASINMNSNRCIISDCQIKYLSHFTTFKWRGYDGAGQAELGHNGIWIKGDNNVIRRCTLKHGAGSGIVIEGGNNLITRSTITEMDYSGTYSCPITIRTSGKGGNEISFCSLGNSGRDIIQLYGSNADIIKFNDIYKSGRLAHDLGMIYAWGNDGKGTRIMYNWIHDNLQSDGPGIYFDNFTSNYIADHNVIWKCGSGVRFNRPNFNLIAYNNTLFNCRDVGSDTYNVWGKTKTPDNWTLGNTWFNISINNLFLGNNPSLQLMDAANKDFRLKPSAPSINSGNIIPGFTDKYVGSKPDKGAYEDGQSKWTAGVNGVDKETP